MWKLKIQTVSRQFTRLENRNPGVKKVLEEGKEIVRETRGWVEEQGKTVSMRTKEYAEDYRCLPKPDLHPVALDRAWIEETGARLPELPEARRDRFMTQHSFSLYDANILTNSRNHGRLF